MNPRFALLWLLAMCACGPRVEVAQPSPFEEDDPSAFRARARTAQPAPAPKAALRERMRHFQVTRAVLDGVLDRGPGPLLRGLEVKPTFRGQEFTGWEIVQFMPGETRFDGIDLMPGDVVGRINRIALIRPEHLNLLWQELRATQAVVIEVHRHGQAFELRFDVREDAKPATP